MSDKKFDFLNNPITCTVTVLALPVGSAPYNSASSAICKCFESRCKKAYRQVENSNDNTDCLFQAVELARYLAEHSKTVKVVKNEDSKDNSESSLLLKRARSVKMMQLQHRLLKTKGWILKIIKFQKYLI